MKGALNTSVIVVKATDCAPQSNARVSPNRRYRFPTLGIETRQLGKLADDNLRVEMIYAGICGTDLHLVQSDPATGFVRTSAPALIPPEGRVIGHEGVGRIVATGSHVGKLRPGDLVAFASIDACMNCDICRRGNFNQCSEARLFGMESDGLFGTTVDVPASLAVDVTAMGGSELDLQAAACLEPAAGALLGCENARVAPGDSVVVFGGGPIGLYCAILCKRVLGASRVAMVEPVASRRDIARNWCDDVCDVDEYFSKRHEAVDVVIEASGDLRNIQKVFTSIAQNGRVVLLGRMGMPLVIEETDHMITNAITIGGSRGHLGGALAKVIALHRSGQLPLNAAVTEVLDSLDELLAKLKAPEKLAEGQCKVLVRIGS